MPTKKQDYRCGQKRHRQLFLVGVKPRRDEGPDLVQDVGQDDQEGDHQCHFHRHQKHPDDVRRDHLAAGRQGRQQGGGKDRIEFPGIEGQRHENYSDRNEDSNQAIAQLDQVGEKSLLLVFHQDLSVSAATGTGAGVDSIGAPFAGAESEVGAGGTATSAANGSITLLTDDSTSRIS